MTAPPHRDTVAAHDGTPAIVSISDIHGYLGDAERALLAVGDHAAHDPVVVRGADGNLHWADNDYVLVFNGDLIDRGPDSAGCVDLAFRLQDEAPAGRVRYHVGNHEAFLLFRTLVDRDPWYCSTAPDEAWRAFFARAADGHVTVAYEGYAYDYSHAGSPNGLDVSRLNERLAAAAADVRAADDDPGRLRAVVDDYDDVFGIGGEGGRGPGAGPLWLDFTHLPADAPPQVVGHTMHDEPTRKGQVVCENVVRRNWETPGGEAVLVETPDGLVALIRDEHGHVEARSLSAPA